MAKQKKKRPARAVEGRLKVITGGGGVKAVLPGKGPQWKAQQRAQAPTTGPHAASSTKSGPPNRRRDEDDEETDVSVAKPIEKPKSKVWIYAAVAIVVLVVAYYFLRNPAPIQTPEPRGVASTSTSASTTASPPASATTSITTTASASAEAPLAPTTSAAPSSSP